MKIGVIPQEFTFFEKTSPREAIIYFASLFGIKTDPDNIVNEVLLQDSANTLFETIRRTETKDGPCPFAR